MSENFRKIKKKYLTVAVVASCILGVCLGVALACALAVVFKTCDVKVHWAVYIPVALVISAGTGFLFFLILRPDDRRIAKKLDRDYSLNQKVQTMVEFANAEGDIHELQREQTDEALGAVAKKRVDLKGLLKFAVVPVVAAAMLFAGIFVPAKKTTGQPEPVYSITDLHKAAIENLIAEVDDSSLKTELKTFIELELSGLLGVLSEAEYERDMKAAVIETVHNVDSLVAASNSYLKIDGVLKSDETLNPFSRAVVNAVVNYKSRGNTSLTSMDVVGRYAGNAEERISAVLDAWKSKYLSEYTPKAEGAQTGTPLDMAAAAEKLRTFADALAAKLDNEDLKNAFAPKEEEEISPLSAAGGDALYNLYVQAAGDFSDLADESASGIYSDNASYYNAIEKKFTSFTAKLYGNEDGGTSALAEQSYGCMMDDYIRNRLSVIFGISRSEFGPNEHVAPSPDEDDGGGNSDREETSGGYGPGNHKYGSNDKFLDPDSGESKKYGEDVDPTRPENGTYLDKYKLIAEQYIQSGKCSPEVEAYIRQYFRYLENGLEQN